MANTRKTTLTDLPKDIFTNAIPRATDPGTAAATMGTLSKVNKHYYGMFREDLSIRAMITLSQASIDDDRDTVRRILSSRPDLLLVDPPKHFVIESQLTWQIFYAEKPAVMAAKRKQSQMLLEVIFPYYDDLPQTEVVKEAKAQALSAWKMYETRRNPQGEDEIVIPADYSNYAKYLIDVFSEETFPNGSDNYGYGMLSEKTEGALSTLFNLLLPEEAVRLDKYLDVELLLLAVYQAYWDHFGTFQNWAQREAFCNRVRGLIQSVLTPEMGKIFCESLDDVVTAIKKGEKKEISQKAASHQLKSGEAFYRVSRDSKEGQGFTIFAGIYGRGGLLGGLRGGAVARFGILISSKNNRLAELMQPKPKTRWCVIV